jgi:hypothetical protein
VTWPLALLAAAALAVIADAAARAWRARTATAAIVRDWHAHAAPVAVRDCAIPVYRVVAEQSVFSLAGWRRPRLYVSARVLDALSPEELAAAVAHERAHHAAADNLKRLLVRAAPDLLVLSPTARDLEDEWCAVAETLADERAGSDDGRRRLALAASLVKVARLGPAEASALPLSALHDGGDVRARVERLFGPAARSAPAASGARAAVGVAVLSAAGAALAASTLPAVHAAIETTARLLR